MWRQHRACCASASGGSHHASANSILRGGSSSRVLCACASHGVHRISASRILHSTGSSCPASAYGGTHRVSASGGVPAPAAEYIAPASAVNTSRQRQPFLKWRQLQPCQPCTLGQHQWWSVSRQQQWWRTRAGGGMHCSRQRLHGTSA